MLEAWMAHALLLWIAGLSGRQVGFRALRRAGLSASQIQAWRRARNRVWRGQSIAAWLVRHMLLGSFGVGGAAATDVWLRFSWSYGDPTLRLGMVALVFGQSALMFAVGRWTAIGNYGRWRMPFHPHKDAA